MAETGHAAHSPDYKTDKRHRELAPRDLGYPDPVGDRLQLELLRARIQTLEEAIRKAHKLIPRAYFAARKVLMDGLREGGE